MDKKRLMQQVNGLVLSLHAINQEEKIEDQDKPVNMEDCMRSYKCWWQVLKKVDFRSLSNLVKER